MANQDMIILIEIVAAYDLELPKNVRNIDPYCKCLAGSTQVHKTLKISKTIEPIWSIITDSLFLLDVKKYSESIQNGLIFQVEHSGISKRTFDLGSVPIPYAEIMSGTGERNEYILYKDGEKSKSCGILSLRFRHASAQEIEFLDFKDRHPKAKVIRPTIYKPTPEIKNFSKPRGSKVNLLRVKPHANPNDVEHTTWMSKVKIEHECIKPSLRWIKSGKGHVGRLFVELIKCDHFLSSFNAFAGIVVEDTFVKTDMIQSCKKPRWMPWSRRSFILPIVHPRSPVILGIFHHEKIGYDRPVGRVVIDLAKLKNHVEYFLTFRLHSDPILRQKKPAGTVTLRVRLEWKEEIDLMSQTLASAPRFIVNVDTEKEFKTVRYLCRGEVNIGNASVETVSGLMRELLSYGSELMYVVDVSAQTLLWRVQGIQTEHEKNAMPAWLRIHSVMFFLSIVTLTENPSLLPSFLCFAITWALLTKLYHGSRDPSPWRRTRSFHQVFHILISGKPTKLKNYNIDSWEGYKLSKEMETLRNLKIKRSSDLLGAILKFGLHLKRKYTLTSADSVSIDTEDKAFVLFGEYLYYIHLPLYYTCLLMRGTSTIVSWHLWSDSVRLTSLFFFSGIFFLFVPWVRVLKWIFRVFCWCQGPWIILLDEKYIRPYYRTDQDLLDAKASITPDFKRILESEYMMGKHQDVRIAFEEACKLRDMRSYLFGTFSQEVPATAISGWKDGPLPESTAKLVDSSIRVEEDYIISGQKLQGNMIHLSA